MRRQTMALRLAVLVAAPVLLGRCVTGSPAAPSTSLADRSPSPLSFPLSSTGPSAGATSSSVVPASAVPATPGPKAAAWHATGAMTAPHAYHTATLLTDGQVLVAGGLINDRVDGKVSASAERFEPTTETWTATPRMLKARWGHTATLLLDGTVLVAGSYVNSSDPLATAELYDPATGRWTATGAMRHGRGGHTATLLRDGRVLVVGGGAEDTSLEGGPRSATAELYDPATGRWSATRNMTQPRTTFTSTLLHDGRVLVAGGDGGFTAAELYDPDTGRWTATGSMTQGRIGHTATLMPDGTVLVTGGCACSEPGAWASAELYDPDSGRWTAAGNMAKPRIFHTATLLPDGRVLVVNEGLHDRPASAELYDPSGSRWTRTARPAHGRVGYTATLLDDGRVLLVGDYAEESESAELYDPGVGT